MPRKGITAMRKTTPAVGDPSTVVWEEIEEMAREHVRGYIQDLLEEELTEFLGRGRYERRAGDRGGYRNGHGKPRRLTMQCGTITVRRPRARDLDERFESRLLPFFVRRTREVDGLLPELYLHGLAEGDFDLALRGLLGEKAPISASTVARLKEKWHGEFDKWSRQDLSGLEVVYLWVDGIYVKAGLEKEKAAVLVALAALSDGTKRVVALKSGHRESTESWGELLRDLRRRGMNSPRLVVGDGNLGIWKALLHVFPESDEQRCWNHKKTNVLDKLPKKAQPEAKPLLNDIRDAETAEDALARRGEFQDWCRSRGYDSAARCIADDWERMVAFYRYPKEHWKHLRTTNPVESPFSSVRLRTDAARRYKKVENATAVIWKVLCVAERRFRRLDAPHLLGVVFNGAKFENGELVGDAKREEEAA
jgi:transposase-like protein